MKDFNFLLSGGFMMYPLLLSALIALTIIFERFYVLRIKLTTDKTQLNSLFQEFGKNSSEGGVDAKTPALSVVQRGQLEFAAGPEELEIILQNQAEKWIPVIEKRLDILDTIITAAPLMGLLGTITGMMSSFQVLSTNGVNEPSAITGGVAEALIATATGLVVALISLVAFNYFNNRVRGLISEMEAAGAKVLELRRRSLRTAL